MGDQKGLYLNEIAHKAFIMTDEEGTEAVATTIIIVGSSLPPKKEKKIYFRADHPFFYIIYHRPAKTILFMGRIIGNPQKDGIEKLNKEQIKTRIESQLKNNYKKISIESLEFKEEFSYLKNVWLAKLSVIDHLSEKKVIKIILDPYTGNILKEEK